ncbi:hypothetical protein B0H66DRAFT_91466 [Apodospora peruviana]|uniref:Response regulatory domain-containing protein n=1 Tax=Apodospora peruviana TaxID=516989 RepID=A0AAE0IU39_9PEZI|nr:hypothetical protein B0H66DRAFT_91466 [Apodospora peruviana]
MGDLRAKLRAKFPRRKSGVPSIAKSSSKTDSTTSESRPASEHKVNGNGRSTRAQSFESFERPGPGQGDGVGDGGADAVSKLEVNPGEEAPGRGASHSGNSGRPETRQATSAAAVADETRDRGSLDRDQDQPRQCMPEKQGKRTATSEPAADVGNNTTSSDENDDDDDNDNDDNSDEDTEDYDDDGMIPSPSASASASAPKSSVSALNSARSSTSSSTTSRSSAKGPQNATNSQPGLSPTARTNMQPTDAASSGAILTANNDPNGNDQRTARAKLSSIHEHASDDNLSPEPQPRTAADDPSIHSLTAVPPTTSDSTSTVANPVRRVRLSDAPFAIDSATPTTKPTVPASLTSSGNSVALRPSSSTSSQPTTQRRQSLLPRGQTTLVRTLLSAVQADEVDPASVEHLLPISAAMVTRKIWVRRPGASATLITINEDDLVDDVREMILRKYANSLGRQFDAPDLTLRIAPREQQRQERVLGPEEPMARTLDAYYPGGQTVDEALIIDIPHRRTPKASPRAGPPHAQHINTVYYEEARPSEGGTDYFGPEAVASIPAGPGSNVPNGTGHPHTISVLNTGQIPQIPSPGGTRRPYRERPDRPRLGRQHTSSPTILNVVGAGGHTATIAVAANHDQSNTGPVPPPAPPLPTPPAPDSTPAQTQRAATPPPRVASPRPVVPRPKKKKTIDHPSLPTGMLHGGVPPISVLIVEDNIINLRLLEAFVKRLKVRWQTAMNGRDAVTKWRSGGFHLVLMDIQLPIMSGLEATREIRRLERMNQIGVFSSTPGSESHDTKNEPSTDEDKLTNRELFKSPVIIVALTASSLQSDRHEALAAGCNDFLTKPVTYVWLERKVMEWGCMQALIDFDGWRKWKDFAPKVEDDAASAAAKKLKAKKNRLSLTTSNSESK